MVDDSYFRFDDNNKKNLHISMVIRRDLSKLKTHSPRYWMEDNWENWLNLRQPLDSIYLINILEVQCLHICLHNYDDECNVQTNERAPQAIMYPVISTNHRLHINNEDNGPVFPGYMYNRCRNMIVQLLHTRNQRKYGNNGKGDYFWFDDDINIGYNYILSIT